MTATVAVLGAGPTALAAAWKAAEAGHRVVVLERSDAVGGLAASTTVAGQRVDLGSHRLHPATDPATLAELQRLLGGSLQWRPRRGRILLEGHLVGYPLRALDVTRSLPPSFAAGVAADALLSPLRRTRHDTFAEVIRAGLGPTMLDRFYGPYARKLWGREPDALSGEHARTRVAAATPAAMLRKLGRRAPTGFWYPARGFGAIPEALAAAARGVGARLRRGAEVTGIDLVGGKARVEVAGGPPVEADLVWSTLPLPTLARLVRPTAAHEVADAARRLPSRAMVLVYLVLDVPRWTPYDAHYLPGGDTPVSRVSEPKNYRDGPDDPPDRTVLCAELPCERGDDAWSTGDDELGRRVVADLARLGLPAVRPVAVETRRVPAAYPVLEPGYERRLAVLEGWVDDLPGVVTLGRGGLHTHDNLHHALAMAAAAVAALDPDGRWDAAAWSIAREGFRGHVVED